ncbi:MAG TPA: acyl-CoA reductase, partial [Chitinophagaceae bacterium]|nr:acyl-CoA reductase [Chitinophagaceae bacterium]
LINRKYYMTNGSILLSENPSVFSPISQLNYEFYTEEQAVVELLENNQDIQCITGNRFVPFGFAQSPSLTDYADGIDTMKFLLQLPLKVA